MDRFDIVIIGAGASGVLTAAHLRHVSPDSSVALMDAGARAARGLAYGTPYGAHLLNVPAGKMSAFAHDPGHFAAWMERSRSGPAGGVFAPRGQYGEYLAEVLAETCAPPSRTRRIPGTVVGLVPRHEKNGTWEVHLHDGQVVGARAVVLALGNLAPSDPLHLGAAAPEVYLRDPWGPGAAQGLPARAPILIIGTGLTMVDLLLALRSEGHEGTVHAISRRGLLPRAHAGYAPRTVLPAHGGLTPRAALRWVRREVAAAAAEGSDWRSVIDGLRASTQDLWASWSTAQRSSFLRHARAYWDVHRHRTAPEVGTQVEALLASGVLKIHAGRIQSLRDAADGVEAQWISRADGKPHTLHAARVINCTGPASDYSTLDQPLVAQLRRAGWLVPDPLRLGVETDADGRLLGKDGYPVPGLFTLGPLRRASLWESTAIPEIRGQAAALAGLLSVL